MSALKIEGRYKDADYVALTTSAYRKAVDDAWAGRSTPSADAEEAAAGTGLLARPRPALRDGTNHQAVVKAVRRGIGECLMGRVIR